MKELYPASNKSGVPDGYKLRKNCSPRLILVFSMAIK